MARTVKICVQLSLKIVNSTLGIVGLAMIIYSAWMVRVWQRDMEGSYSDHHSLRIPWFIIASVGIGITLCAITCFGHIAAHTANVHWLSCYMVSLILLILVETVIVADMLLNSDWEKDFPKDPTGLFDDFKDFMESNFQTCKWIGFLFVLAQGCSFLLATVLRTLDKDQGKYLDRDNDYAPSRVPFMGYPVHPLPYTVADLPYASKNEDRKAIFHDEHVNRIAPNLPFHEGRA